MAAATLVTLAQAKAYLRLATPDGHADDPALTLTLAAAEDAIRDYLSPYEADAERVAAWTDETVPPLVQEMILFQTGEFWRFRGDDLEGGSVRRDLDRGDLHPMVVGALRRLRTPVIA
jgi:hypothetical protein